MATSSAQRKATGRDGIAQPTQWPCMAIPNGRGRRTATDRPMSSRETRLIETSRISRCHRRRKTTRTIMPAKASTLRAQMVPSRAATVRMPPVSSGRRRAANRASNQSSTSVSETPRAVPPGGQHHQRQGDQGHRGQQPAHAGGLQVPWQRWLESPPSTSAAVQVVPERSCEPGLERCPWTPPTDSWSASDFAIENRVWIRQHPLGLLTRGGGSDRDRARACCRPAGPTRQAVPDPVGEVRDLAAAGPRGDHHRRGRRPVRGGSLDDHAAAHSRQGRRDPGAGRVQAWPGGCQAGRGVGGGHGGGGPAGRGAQGDGRQADAHRGKRALGLSGRVPARVDQATKAGLLELLEQACGQGWTVRAACQVLQVNELRVYRWLHRRAAGELKDRAPGGSPMHGLLDWEVTEILRLFEQWGEVDRSHRKLAHRGSYLERVWVSPASVRRVLARQGLRLRPLPRPGRSVRKPFPDWVDYRPGSIWIYDTTHFNHAGVAATVVEDLVSRRWLAEVVSAEETSTQVQVVFTEALEREGLLARVSARQDGLVDPTIDDPARPVLLALSDNGPQMTSGSTREFMALCAIHQHFGRPGTPTDQAWIESLFGHVKAEWPHLNAIRDPAVLRAELAVVRERYNGVRLHAGIGYVTPNDEHEGRGPAIRKAREAGLEQARLQRLAWHREHRQPEPPEEPGDVG